MPPPPHLLVVGAGNFLDLGPAWLKQYAKRGARSQILLYPPPSVFFKTNPLFMSIGVCTVTEDLFR